MQYLSPNSNSPNGKFSDSDWFLQSRKELKKLKEENTEIELNLKSLLIQINEMLEAKTKPQKLLESPTSNENTLKKLIKTQNLITKLQKFKTKPEMIDEKYCVNSPELANLHKKAKKLESENQYLKVPRISPQEFEEDLLLQDLSKLQQREKDLESLISIDSKQIKHYQDVISLASLTTEKLKTPADYEKSYLEKEIEVFQAKNKGLKVLIKREQRAWDRIFTQMEESINEKQKDIIKLQQELNDKIKSCRELKIKLKKAKKIPLSK
ncbi:hypothetical protein SteCoe_15592 [Stentor coeruleus]|uniref:Uncharacterized protein n=1 Tax=Stentor coeruleus TaxID=5963 RepID=A0A1R2C3E8_9CILI|nr:hypothetical protein SteCoe_15592 [Stentor coeruleus]